MVGICIPEPNLDLDWQNIEFKNFDSHCEAQTKENKNKIKYTNNKNDPPLIVNIHNKYYIQQKIIKLLSNDTIFNYEDGIQQIQSLYPSMKNAYSQLKTDFYRQVYTINNHRVYSYNNFTQYIEYSIKSHLDKKLLISSCTQAIMSIPLLGINKYFDLQQYFVGEIDSEIDDKSMYIDIDIDGNEWSMHIQKPLRIFDTYGTLYCVLLDLDIDQNGLIVSIRPFL